MLFSKGSTFTEFRFHLIEPQQMFESTRVISTMKPWKEDKTRNKFHNRIHLSKLEQIIND
jgi:hypothetical protein